MYGITTMITALISGYLFNVNKYLPMYISLIIYFIIFIISFKFYEVQVKEENNNEEIKTNKDKKIELTSTIFFVILSNAIFYSIIKIYHIKIRGYHKNIFSIFLFAIKSISYPYSLVSPHNPVGYKKLHNTVLCFSCRENRFSLRNASVLGEKRFLNAWVFPYIQATIFCLG